jgi:predicted aspartyl protease
MWINSSKTVSQIVISSILLFGIVACNSDSETTSTTQATPAKVKTTPTPVVKPTIKNVASLSATTPTKPDNSYEQAIDIAAGAATIAKSAVSREDWTLVVNQWQQAIALMKKVPAANRNRSDAQKKLAQYQSSLTEAKEKAAPPPSQNSLGDVNPQFFSIPIKSRIGGTPIVEVVFDGTQKFDMLFDTGATGTLITASMAKTLNLKPVGLTSKGVADGAVVTLKYGFVKSMETDGRIKRKQEVAIAPPAMPIGLLGQDFFQDYDIAIKENIIEFRKR